METEKQELTETAMKSLRMLAGTGERRLEYLILEPDLLTLMLDEIERLRAFEARMRELSRQTAPIWMNQDGETGWDYVTQGIAEELGEVR